MYARAVCALVHQPRTVIELAEALGVFINTASAFIRVMHQRGLVHVDHWRPPACRGFHMPVYAFGPGPDAPVLGRSCRLPKPLLRPFAGMIAFAEMVQAMLREPCTPHDMREQSGLAMGTIYRVIRVMRDEDNRALRITDWDCLQARKLPLPAYQIGVGPDARRPQPLTTKQVNRRYRERCKEREVFQPLAAALAANNSIFNLARSA